MAQPRSTARDLAQIAIFAALIAALGIPGQFNLGSSAVPITLQTLGVMLAGALLGARKGFFAVATLMALVAAGLPLLAGGRGGPAVFVGASAGYLWGWLLGVVVIGWLTKRILPAYPLWLGLIVTAVGGIGAIYLLGIPWVSVRADLPLWAAFTDSGKFVPGDAIKVVVTALVAKQVHRAYPGLMTPRTTSPSAAAETQKAPDALAG